jgi:Galactose oxidase, central domain
MRAFSADMNLLGHLGLGAALCAGLAGCSAPVVGVDLSISTKACTGALVDVDSSRDPSAGVDRLNIQITGDAMSPSSVDAAFADGTAHLPNLPLGTNRRITVAAYKGSTLWARADSGSFDLQGGGDLSLSLQLRVVDTFTLTGPAGGGACTSMVDPRVGHAMTLLDDGRVLITGGFYTDQGGNHYQDAAEIYDPQSGTFTLLSSPPSYRREGHSALAVSLGAGLGTGVLLIGGEGPTDTGPEPVRQLELFSRGSWTIIQPPTASPAREHHSAVIDLKTGFAVFAGGLTGPDTTPLTSTVLDSVSYYDPLQKVVIDGTEPLAQPLFDAAAVSRSNSASGGPSQGGMVLIGGRDSSGNALDQLSGIVFSDTGNRYVVDKLWEQPGLTRLPGPRVRHLATRLADDRVLVLGGLTQATIDYSSATDAVTVIDPLQATVADAVNNKLSQARADGCGALLEDGTVLFAGGAWRDAGGPHSARVADLVSTPSTGTSVRSLSGPVPGNTWGLQMARHRAACIRLKDGSVLITGGFQFDASGNQVALTSAEIYMPAHPPPPATQ